MLKLFQYYCDICGKEIDPEKGRYTFKLNQTEVLWYEEIHNKTKCHMCDSCYKDLVYFIKERKELEDEE